ncbi:MAG TPA: hypothetical protein VE988_26290 [Gemmataceae bacterium]|nr:hypothetical protein [Gemmataceae bacterium]
MSTGAAPKETLPLTAEQKQVVGNLASSTKAIAGLLLLIGVVLIASGPVSYIYLMAGLLQAILTTVQGLLMCLLALVMLAVSSDFKFLEQFPHYSGNHLRNAANNLTRFHQVQLGLAVLIALVVLARWLT